MLRHGLNRIGGCASGRAWRRTAFFVVPLAFLAGCTNPEPKPAAPPADPQAAVADPTAEAAAPEVALADEARLTALLESQRGAGKPLLINVWATWCTPCVEEMPDLAAFYMDRANLAVEFLSLSADFTYEVNEKVKPFLKDRSIPFPVYVVDGVDPGRLAELLGVTETGWDGALPGTFLYDAQGTLVQSWLEKTSHEALTSAVAGLPAT